MTCLADLNVFQRVSNEVRFLNIVPKVNFSAAVTLYCTRRDLSGAAFTAHKAVKEEENRIKKADVGVREIGSCKSGRKHVNYSVKSCELGM